MCYLDELNATIAANTIKISFDDFINDRIGELSWRVGFLNGIAYILAEDFDYMTDGYLRKNNLIDFNVHTGVGYRLNRYWTIDEQLVYNASEVAESLFTMARRLKAIEETLRRRWDGESELVEKQVDRIFGVGQELHVIGNRLHDSVVDESKIRVEHFGDMECMRLFDETVENLENIKNNNVPMSELIRRISAASERADDDFYNLAMKSGTKEYETAGARRWILWKALNIANNSVSVDETIEGLKKGKVDFEKRYKIHGVA